MSIEAMRMAQAYIRWNKFGECRVEGWDHHIPTAAEVDVALTNAIRKAEKEQADFQDFVAKVQEVEKEACEIINREWASLTRDEMLNIIDLHTCIDPDGDKHMKLVKMLQYADNKLRDKNT